MIIHPITKANFHGQPLDVWEINGQRWLRGGQIASPLMTSPGTIKKIFKRHRSEFTSEMTAIITVPTPGGAQQSRIFSARGAALIAMLAQSPRAAEFRVWILDMLEGRDRQAPPEPALTATARGQLIRLAMKADPRLRSLLRYLKLGLTQREAAKLLDLSPASVRKKRRALEALGLIEPPANLARMRHLSDIYFTGKRGLKADG